MISSETVRESDLLGLRDRREELLHELDDDDDVVDRPPERRRLARDGLTRIDLSIFSKSPVLFIIDYLVFLVDDDDHCE